MNFYGFLEKMGLRQIERVFLFPSLSIEYASASNLHLCTVFHLVRMWQYCPCVTTICCHSFRYETVVTVLDTKPVSLKLITLPRDEFAKEEKKMAIQNTACYYGRHFGCVTMLQNPDCRRCSDRLTHAVNAGRLPSSANQLHETAMSSARAHLNTTKLHRESITARHLLWQ